MCLQFRQILNCLCLVVISLTERNLHLEGRHACKKSLTVLHQSATTFKIQHKVFSSKWKINAINSRGSESPLVAPIHLALNMQYCAHPARQRKHALVKTWHCGIQQQLEQRLLLSPKRDIKHLKKKSMKLAAPEKYICGALGGPCRNCFWDNQCSNVVSL